MDPFKKYLNNTALFSIVSDYITNYVNFINEKPLSFVLAPLTLTIFCYYIYVYIRKFYPIYVNCWFCNANFKVAFEDRFEYTCIECEQFNGFKKDGSYSKIIPEQHDQRLNRTVFTVIQNNVKESKNGLCHKCNIIQEMKIKQLAAFTPINEKNFDREIEIFKENLEETLKLCSKCYIFSKKILSLQEQRYSLKSTRINKQDIRDVSDWPNVCSLFLSTIVLLLSSSAKNYLSDWTANFIDTSIFDNSVVIVSYSIGMASLGGILCQVYHCLTTMDKLSGIIMLLWSILFVINNFEIFINFKPKLLVSVFIVLLSSTSILKNLTRKQKIRQTSIKLEDETYEFPTANYYDISTNGSGKNSDESEMMDIDYTEKESPKRVKKLNKSVNNLFQGMKLNDNRGVKNNFIRPPKLFVHTKRDKFAGYAETSPGYYPSYSMKDDYEFDTQSVYSQQSYRSHCSALCHQAVSPYTYYAPHHHQQPSPLNLSHASNISNIQQSSEWSKMLMYSIPGFILLTLQCYLLYDIKDYMKQK